MNKDNKKLNDNELENVSGGTVPELPATELHSSSYSQMFSGCTEPNTIPDFPAPEIERG